MEACNALLLRDPRPARRGRRFHHRAGDQPDVRRDGRRRARRLLAPRRSAGGRDLCRARARARNAGERCAAGDARARASAARCTSSRPARCCATSSAKRHPDAAWHDTLESLPEGGPLLLVANEFFDALPVRQFVGGIERRVTLIAGGPGIRPRRRGRSRIRRLAMKRRGEIGTLLDERGGVALDRRLWPCEERAGRHAAGGARRIASPPLLHKPGRAGFDRACRFRGAGERGGGRRGRRSRGS